VKGKPRILIIDNSQYVTGALKAILNFCLYSKASFDFIFILPKNSKAIPYVKEQEFPVIGLPFVELQRKWRSALVYLPMLLINGCRVKRIVQKKNVSLVHANDFYNLTGVVAKAMGGSFKLITHVRFMPDRFPSVLVKSWLYLNIKYADAVIAVSGAVKKRLPESPKVHLIYDGINYFPFVRNKTKQKEVINLLYLAHYIPGKGQDLALEAFYKAYQHNGNLRLRFVGGDTGLEKNRMFRNQLMAKAKELGLVRVVEFKGPVKSIDKEMAFADVALNFSESESFSMTCLEALVNGVPLIASDCGGPAELFEHEISGLLVANKDIEAMCRAILHLTGDMEKRLKFSENSINYVKKKFSSKATFQKLSNVYKAILLDP
jgi:glycosyltransferase involved in cell wall biosynthesis